MSACIMRWSYNYRVSDAQRETDMWHGPVFYDNLVEVGLAD